MNADDNDDGMSWLRLRPSFREAYSRGSQTTTEDLDEECLSDTASRPVTPANNVRRASLLWGDLQALYTVQAAEGTPPPSQPEVRAPPSPRNPWNIYYRNEILPELCELFHGREVWNQKCCGFVDKVSRRRLLKCFSSWRQCNLRHLDRDYLAAVDADGARFFKRQKTNVVRVWAQVSMGLSSAQQHDPGIPECEDTATGGCMMKSWITEAIAQRLIRKNEGSASINTSMIREEAKQLLSSKFGLDVWMYSFNSLKYFRLWREARHLPFLHFNETRCRLVVSRWRALSKAAKDSALNRSRYEKAKSFHWRKVTFAVFKRWKMRIDILSRFACLCLKQWAAIQDERRRQQKNALGRWARVVEVHNVYYKRPFHMWRELAFNEKHRFRVNDRLAAVFLSKNIRRRLWTSFRAWRKETRFGEITAKFTKDELASQLLRQRHQCEELTRANDSLEGTHAAYEEMRMRVQRLEEKLRQSEKFRQAAELRCSTTSSSRQFRESLDVLSPVLLHSNNML